MTDLEASPMRRFRFKGLSALLILLGGLVGVPLVLTLFFNSWDAPTAADYVRMAFVSVACSTVAIVTVLVLLVNRIVRKAPLSSIAVLGVIALVVVPMQLDNFGNASDLLLSRLNLH